MTEGNLGSHIRVLEEAEYIQVTKIFEGKKPKTIRNATKLGIKRFRDYIDGLEKIICMAQSAKTR